MVTLVLTSITGALVTGGGVTTMAFEDPVDDTGAATMLGWVGDFWDAIKAHIVNDVTFSVQGNPQRYAAANGELQEIFDADPPAAVTGEDVTDPVAKATQALIRWRTADIVDGRAIRGRTFIPGLASSDITALGELETTVRGALDTAAAGLITDSGGVFSIWHRPQSDGGDPPVYSGGSSHLVTSASTATSWAVLRSRRD